MPATTVELWKEWGQWTGLLPPGYTWVIWSGNDRIGFTAPKGMTGSVVCNEAA